MKHSLTPKYLAPFAKLLKKNILFGAVFIGLMGGGLAIAYSLALESALHWIWIGIYGSSYLEVSRSVEHPFRLVAITSVGGLLIGLCIKWLGAPGELAAVVDNIHLQNGRLRIQDSPSMIVNSLISISVGGSAGPESPMVQIIGSFASWFSTKLKLSEPEIRTYTFCGMASALGALFGEPIGGALFALEIPHRRGLEYYEALIPACLSAIVSFVIFRSVTGWEPPLFASLTIKDFSVSSFYLAIALGALGAAIGSGFAFAFKSIERFTHQLKNYPVFLGCFGGLAIGFIALWFPETLFWGEFQIQGLLTSSASSARLFSIAIVKLLTISITLHCGFRGGFIFPLFFIGAALGLAISAIFPTLPTAVLCLSLMAAINVAVTKTPLSTTVILASLSSATALPILAIASFASFILSSRVSLIGTQRSRVATR